jgi:hypothetical protein
MTNKYEFLRDDVNHKFLALINDLNSRKALVVKTKLEPCKDKLNKELDHFGDMPPLTTHITLFKMHNDEVVLTYESIQSKYEDYADELNKLITQLVAEIKKRTTTGRQPAIPREEVTPEENAELEVEGTEPDELPPLAQTIPNADGVPNKTLLEIKAEEATQRRSLRKKLTKEERTSLIMNAYYSLPEEKRTGDRIMKLSGMTKSHVYLTIKGKGLKFSGVFRKKGMKLSGIPINTTKNEAEFQGSSEKSPEIPMPIKTENSGSMDKTNKLD